MAVDFSFRRKAVGKLTGSIGVYVFADLDNVPVYAGQSTGGIRQRVRRHLTSARSDVIANRQIDVREIAYVWEYPVAEKRQIAAEESTPFRHFNLRSRLMNGAIPAEPPPGMRIPEPAYKVQVMSDEEIAEKKIELRVPWQAGQYAQIVGHFLAVKNSNQAAHAMDAHINRLSKYHAVMPGLGSDEEP